MLRRVRPRPPVEPETSASRWRARPGPLDAITDVPGVAVGHDDLISGDRGSCGRHRPGAHRRHRHLSPRARRPRAGLRRLVQPQRQRRDDRHGLDRRLRPAAVSHHHHQHQQRRHRTGRSDRVGAHPVRRRIQLLPSGRGRDLGRRPQRHLRISRHQGARLRGPGGRQAGTGRGGERRRRYRHAMPRLQGRNRHGQPASSPTGTAGSPLAYWSSATSAQTAAPHRGGAGGAGDHRAASLLRHRRPAGPARAAERCPGGAGATGARVDHRRHRQPMRRCSRISSAGWPAAPRWGSAAWAGSRARVRAICSSRSPPRQPEPPATRGVRSFPMLEDERIDPVYEATVQATEEAIINAMLAAKTMTRRR